LSTCCYCCEESPEKWTGLEPPKLYGRHNAIPDDSDAEAEADAEAKTDILEWIQHQAEKFQPSTRIYILHYCAYKFGKIIIRGWVDSFLVRHKDELAETISKPQEEVRLQVPREFLLGRISRMEEAMQSCVRDLVFNLDEVGVGVGVGVGVSEWEDLKSKKVVVPTGTNSQTIHDGVHRNLKRRTPSK
jgi:hypothetical protein